MRIVAGTLKGRNLPELKADNVRPTLDRVRENLFNIISSYMHDATFLDLFTGSGAIGFEAISRGAGEVIFCDRSPQVIAHVEDCAKKFGIQVKTLKGDYKANLSRLSGKMFDIIYLDPPYEFNSQEVLDAVKKANVTGEKSIVIYEHEAGKPFESIAEFEVFDERKYGKAILTLMRLK